MFRRVRAGRCLALSRFFFFNDTATTEIYTLSLHDALPIFLADEVEDDGEVVDAERPERVLVAADLSEVLAVPVQVERSGEHTSELQSRQYLVCRLLLGKKNHRTCGAARAARPETAVRGGTT